MFDIDRGRIWCAPARRQRRPRRPRPVRPPLGACAGWRRYWQELPAGPQHSPPRGRAARDSLDHRASAAGPRLDGLIIEYRDHLDKTRHLGRKRGDLAPNIGIIGLFTEPACARPVPGDPDQRTSECCAGGKPKGGALSNPEATRRDLADRFEHKQLAPRRPENAQPVGWLRCKRPSRVSSRNKTSQCRPALWKAAVRASLPSSCPQSIAQDQGHSPTITDGIFISVNVLMHRK